MSQMLPLPEWEVCCQQRSVLFNHEDQDMKAILKEDRSIIDLEPFEWDDDFYEEKGTELLIRKDEFEWVEYYGG